MRVTLNAIEIHKNRIDYNYSYDAELEKFFDADNPFFIEYGNCDIDFASVPKSILAIPFITNLLPLCWLCDFELAVKELDRAFFESIETIKNGFQKIYSQVQFKGTVSVQSIVENYYEPSKETTCLFSGGVDATFTFLRHREEHPTLINVWGVDIGLNDARGHAEMESYCNKISLMFQTDYVCIKSTIRRFLNELVLNDEMYPLLGDYWWHGAQHSIGLLSLLAPYNYVNKVATNYIASTFTQKEFDMGIKCVSYPIVDNALKMASTKVHHDGFEYERIDKIKSICDTRRRENLRLDLKVCFHFRNGMNCCRCEKCYRTIMAILVFDKNIEFYGFRLESKDAKEIKRFLTCNEIGRFRWEPIQEAYIANPYNSDIRWLKEFRFNNLSSLKSRMLRIFWRLQKKIGRNS